MENKTLEKKLVLGEKLKSSKRIYNGVRQMVN